jgi:hypothetical protein
MLWLLYSIEDNLSNRLCIGCPWKPLCTLAKDRLILAPHNIATGEQFSHDQWESYKALLGLPVTEKRSPFNFIGGMFYGETLPDKLPHGNWLVCCVFMEWMSLCLP